jgi:hypothetical protein
LKVNPVLVLGGALLWSVVLLGGPTAGAQDSRDAEAWGGRGITMQLTAQGATIEFDCGHGSISRRIHPNASGHFRVPGTYTPERGGPVMKDNAASDLPATYEGTIRGDSMTLKIVLSDKDRQPTPFTLTRGKRGRVVKCR